MVTDILGTPVDVGHFVLHIPTGNVYLVNRVYRQVEYGVVVSKVRVKSGYRNLVLTNKYIVRSTADGRTVVDSNSAVVLN